MASRWLQGKRNIVRNHKRKLKNQMTKLEERFYRPKILISKTTGKVIKVESLQEHHERMQKEGTEERLKPKMPTAVLARLLQVPSIAKLPLNSDEQKIIQSYLIKDNKNRVMLNPEIPISKVEQSILRYRRLTGRKE